MSSNPNDTERRQLDNLMKQAWHLAWVEKKPKSAIRLLRECMIINRQFADPQLEVAKIAFHLLPGRIELASDAINSYLSMVPNSADAYYYRALIHAAKSDLLESMNCYQKAIELDPFDIRSKVGLAQLLLKTNSTAAGIKLLEQAVEQASVQQGYAEPATRSVLASAYEKLGMIEKSAEQWEIIAKLRRFWPEDEDFGNLQTSQNKFKSLSSDD